nr:LysR family transcriptional regulator [Nocardioides sp. J54]
MHVRKLRQFIVVAEELHFSRAAARLYVAQQALSRQVKELEEELGATLFRRSTRSVELTAAGRALLEGARATVEAWDRAVARTTSAARAEQGVLRVGSCPAAALELTSPILRELEERLPDVEVEMREHLLTDPSAGLLDHSADVAFVRVPATLPGMEVVPLFTEPLVVSVAAGHCLAERDRVSVAEVLDEPITVSRTEDAAYRAFWQLAGFRDEAPAVLLDHTSVIEEGILVASGRAVSVTVAAAARYGGHPDLRFVPIVDAPRSTLAVALPAAEPSPLARAFLDAAVTVRDREAGLVAAIEDPEL